MSSGFATRSVQRLAGAHFQHKLKWKRSGFGAHARAGTDEAARLNWRSAENAPFFCVDQTGQSFGWFHGRYSCCVLNRLSQMNSWFACPEHNEVVIKLVPACSLQERIVLTDDDLPSVPIVIKGRVLRISAEDPDGIFLLFNLTRTSAFLMDGDSFVEIANCAVVWELSSEPLARDVLADTHAALNLLPAFVMQVLCIGPCSKCSMICQTCRDAVRFACPRLLPCTRPLPTG